jgi:hypothetical protein
MVFHITTLLISYHTFFAGASAIISFPTTGVEIFLATGNHYYHCQEQCHREKVFFHLNCNLNKIKSKKYSNWWSLEKIL